MGNLVWHTYARFVSITASVCKYLRLSCHRSKGADRPFRTSPQMPFGQDSGASSTVNTFSTLWVVHCATLEECSTLCLAAHLRLRTANLRHGIRAPNSAAPLVAIIVKIPLVQIIAMTLGLIMLAIEYPVPLIKEYAIHRSFVIRIVLLLFQVVVNILYYQVSFIFINGASPFLLT